MALKMYVYVWAYIKQAMHKMYCSEKVSSISRVSRHIQRATTALGLLRIYHVEAPLALLRRGAKSTYHEQELCVF